MSDSLQIGVRHSRARGNDGAKSPAITQFGKAK